MTAPTVADDITTRIDGVELITVGTHDATTGKARITTADLQAMVDAFGNPRHDAAPVKLGHDDDRFQDANGNPPSRRDGEPAYGWVENLRLSDDKRTLIGDLIGVPQKLADIMGTAFRRRSVELVRHERVGGRVYAAVLTGLSLLGVQAPAVKGLADLRALFAEQLDEPPVRESVFIGDDTPPVPHSTGQTPQRDPETLSGGIPTSGATMRLTKAQRAALDIPDGATTEQVREALAKRGLHMAEGDTYEEDNEEVTPNEPKVPNPAPEPTPADPTPPPPPPAEPAAKVAAAAPESPPTAEAIMLAAGNLGLTVVDKERFAQLQADAAAGRAARDQQNNENWDRIIREAVNRGKLAPTAFALWRSNIAENPELVIKLLAGLPEGELPTKPLGHGEAFAGGDPDTEASNKSAAARRAKLLDYFSLPPVDVNAKG